MNRTVEPKNKEGAAMSKVEYSDERREAFLAFSRLHGDDTALKRCDADATRRWFHEKEDRKETKGMRWVRRCFVFAGIDIALLFVLACLLGWALPDELYTVGSSVAGIAIAVGIVVRDNTKERTFDDISRTDREDILSHFFMSDAELAEVEAEKAEDDRRAETVLARFNDTVSAEGFGNGKAGA